MTKCSPCFKNRKIKLSKVADIERGKNDKIYPAGCTLIPLSASDYTLIKYLKNADTVSSRFAVVRPHEFVNSEYLYIAILQAAEAFFATYKTGINLQLSILQKFFTIRYHDDSSTQKYIVDHIQLVNQYVQNVIYEMETYKNMKKNMLSRMLI